MSKLLPHFFSVLLVIWIYGGTMWYQKNFCCEIQPVKLETTKTISDAHPPSSQKATQLSFLPAKGKAYLMSYKPTTQPLNLFFQYKKYQFVETLDLETYFKNLNQYLKENRNIVLKISAYAHITEGVSLAKKRLDFIREYMYNRKFPLEQIIFENKGFKPATAHHNQQIFENQLIEIRFISF
jgi:hypothetical protein